MEKGHLLTNYWLHDVCLIKSGDRGAVLLAEYAQLSYIVKVMLCLACPLTPWKSTLATESLVKYKICAVIDFCVQSQGTRVIIKVRSPILLLSGKCFRTMLAPLLCYCILLSQSQWWFASPIFTTTLTFNAFHFPLCNELFSNFIRKF